MLVYFTSNYETNFTNQHYENETFGILRKKHLKMVKIALENCYYIIEICNRNFLSADAGKQNMFEVVYILVS